MCGIAGIIGSLDKKQKLEQLSQMNQAMFHRGPDDYGEWANELAGIGMRRLSIVDLAGGHQPIWHQSVGIVFNGEIYNHQTLREELIQLGYEFFTESDTEVILKAYCQWGESSLSKLIGMYTICIIDLERNTAFLVRDHTGIKPLYIATYNSNLYFASEIKAFKNVIPLSDINFDSIDDYLTFRYIPSDNTAWLNVKKLTPGTYLKICLKELSIEKICYWQLNFRSEPISKSRDYVKEFDQLFSESVQSQLVADVPVGAFLSGGLDSTAICAKAIELGHTNFHTFSVAFEQDTEFSELSYAAIVAEHLGTQHHEVIVTQKQFLDFIKKQPYFTDDPLADMTSVPLYFLALEARKHIKVALSGEGADEILAGYSLENDARRADKRKLTKYIPTFLYPLLIEIMPQHVKHQFEVMHQQGWGGYVSAEPQYISRHMEDSDKLTLWNTRPNEKSSFDKIRNEYKKALSDHPIDKLQQVLSSSWLIDDLLAKADKMSMAASLEVRVPFLDHNLINWAMRLPVEWKVGDKTSGYSTKRILRETVKSSIPKSILERKKQGFPVPVYKWLERDLGKQLGDELLSNGFLNDWFNQNKLEKIVMFARNGDINSQHNFWLLYTLGHWKKTWIN